MRKLIRRIFNIKDDPYSEIIKCTSVREEDGMYYDTLVAISLPEIRYIEENGNDLDTTLVWIKGRADCIVVKATFEDFLTAYNSAYVGYLLNQKLIHGK
jgi:hypothetical protein